MEGNLLTKRSGFVFALALAALSMILAPGIAIADGVSTTLGQTTEVAANSTSALSQSVSGTMQSATGVADDVTADTTQAVTNTTQAVGNTTQAVSNTTQAGTEVVADAASGAGSNLNAARAVADKNASSTVSLVHPTDSTVQGDASGAQDGGATATVPESTTAPGDPVASSADPRLVRSRDPMWIDWAAPYPATATSSSAIACPRLSATCIEEASSNPGGSLGDAVVLAIRWLATTGLDILFKLVLAFGLALAGALVLEAARRQQAPQLR